RLETARGRRAAPGGRRQRLRGPTPDTQPPALDGQPPPVGPEVGGGELTHTSSPAAGAAENRGPLVYTRVCRVWAVSNADACRRLGPGPGPVCHSACPDRARPLGAVGVPVAWRSRVPPDRVIPGPGRRPARRPLAVRLAGAAGLGHG